MQQCSDTCFAPSMGANVAELAPLQEKAIATCQCYKVPAGGTLKLAKLTGASSTRATVWHNASLTPKKEVVQCSAASPQPPACGTAGISAADPVVTCDHEDASHTRNGYHNFNAARYYSPRSTYGTIRAIGGEIHEGGPSRRHGQSRVWRTRRQRLEPQPIFEPESFLEYDLNLGIVYKKQFKPTWFVANNPSKTRYKLGSKWFAKQSLVHCGI